MMRGRFDKLRLFSLLSGMMLAVSAAGSASAARPFALATAPSGTWHPIASCPVAHAGHSAVYDPVGDRMIVFGGYTQMDGSPQTNDTWVLSLSDPPTWTLLAVAGPRPDARTYAAAIFDPLRNRMLIYGGGGYRTDLWDLALSGTPTWHLLSTTGSTPSGNAPVSAVYDAARDRMVVVGDGVWALQLSAAPAWSQIVPSGSGVEGFAVYDAAGDRVLVGTHQLTLSGPMVWQALAPSGTPPPGGGASVAYDPIRDRVLWFGGSSFSCDPGPICTTTRYADCTALQLSGPQWQALQAGPHKSGHTAIYDPVRDRMVVMGGEARGGLNSFAEDDAWIFESQSGAGVEDDDGAKHFDLRLAGPNPVHGSATFDLVVSEATDVAVSVHDVRGGRVTELARARFGPGHHPVTWSGDDASGRQAPAGIYFVRANMGAAATTVRVAVVH